MNCPRHYQFGCSRCGADWMDDCRLNKPTEYRLTFSTFLDGKPICDKITKSFPTKEAAQDFFDEAVARVNLPPQPIQWY